VEVLTEEGTGEVHGLRGPGFASVQFHPESVLTPGGIRMIGELLGEVIGRDTRSRRDRRAVVAVPVPFLAS
jgi:phenazine biosynthesis protein phzE